MNINFIYEESNVEDARSAYIKWFLENHPELEGGIDNE